MAIPSVTPLSPSASSDSHVLNKRSFFDSSFPLDLWRNYLLSTTQEDIAVSWRIFTQIAAHTAIMAVRTGLCMQLLNCSDQEPSVKYETKLICSRLENASWRLWHKKSNDHKEKKQENVAEKYLFQQREPTKSPTTLQRAVSEPSIFGLPDSARVQQNKVTEWLSQYEKSLTDIEEEHCDGDMNDEDCDSEWSDEDCDSMSCGSLIDSSYNSLRSIKPKSLLTRMINEDGKRSERYACCDVSTLPPCIRAHLLKKVPAEPCLQRLIVTVSRKDMQKKLNYEHPNFYDSTSIW
ncbi:hypothetical protein MP638_003116 [Amoeboaphelidium occidentale]|nr:hypothetical protein MP638_003116 [Amoeboaphelidium occidentale]